MQKKTFFIETHGCQMNVYDSEFISSLLKQDGYTAAKEASEAGLILINTCSVRGRAERKALSRLRELSALKKENPNVVLGVVGCMAQRLGDTITDEVRHVDFVLGPDTYLSLVTVAGRLQRERSPVIDVTQDAACLYESRPEVYDSVTAFVTVMRGCDNFCSYCVVPYVRGRERSKAHAEVVKEIRHMVRLGVKEITLLGQNVNSYDDGEVDFASLLEMANGVEGLERIRFTTSHPKDMTERVIGCIRDLPKVCEHLHLPIQSGSDRILKLMNRRYDYSQYKKLVETARDMIPGLAVSTDLMVGFPSETVEDHHATLEALEEIAFESAFMFRYSTRSGTGAADLEDDVASTEKTRRLDEVITLQNRTIDGKKKALPGEEVEILIEGQSKREPAFWVGRTRKNWLAKLPRKGVRKGEVVRARVTGVTRWMITCDRPVRKVGT